MLVCIKAVALLPRAAADHLLPGEKPVPMERLAAHVPSLRENGGGVRRKHVSLLVQVPLEALEGFLADVMLDAAGIPEGGFLADADGH